MAEDTTSMISSVSASAAALLLVAGCAADPDSEQAESLSEGQMAQPSHLPFSESAGQLNDEVLEAVESGSMLDPRDYDSTSDFQEAVVELYVEARLETQDPVLAEARIAHLYDEDTLDRRAGIWAQGDLNPESDFIGVHQAGSSSEMSIRSSTPERVSVEWVSEVQAGCDSADLEDHWASVLVETEETEAGYRITGFSHELGCGCASCTSAA